MRALFIALWMLFASMASAMAQVSIGIGINMPGMNIGINLPAYPEMVLVPGYPVYYAPRLRLNLFFYDGLYWAYQGDDWYASSWYNGPWGLVAPEYVPLYVLRIPVRYYRNPPRYFRGWRPNAPPRWDEHWGREWEQQRSGWDQWNRRAMPAPAPLPTYQRQYSGYRYPREEQQQRTLHNQNYRYQPRDAVVQQHYREQIAPSAPAPVRQAPQTRPQERNPWQPEQERQRYAPPAPPPQGVPFEPHPQPQPGAVRREQQEPQRVAPPVPPQQGMPLERHPQPQPGAARREPPPVPHQANGPQDRGTPQEPERVQGQGQRRDKARDKEEERDRERERNR